MRSSCAYLWRPGLRNALPNRNPLAKIGSQAVFLCFPLRGSLRLQKHVLKILVSFAVTDTLKALWLVALAFILVIGYINQPIASDDVDCVAPSLGQVDPPVH